MKSLTQIVKISDDWHHAECVIYSHLVVHAEPFFVCPNRVDATFSGFLSYICHHTCEVINY